jgi:hypothetical protein
LLLVLACQGQNFFLGQKMGKGVTLSKEELLASKELLNKVEL